MVIWSPDKRKKNNISFCSASRVVLSLGGLRPGRTCLWYCTRTKKHRWNYRLQCLHKGQKIEFKLLEQPLRRHYYCRPPLPIRKKNIPISFFQSLTSFACILAFKMVSSGSNSLATSLGVKKSVDELQVNMDSFLLVYFEFDFSSQTYVQ